jgi:hypothetical protein
MLYITCCDEIASCCFRVSFSGRCFQAMMQQELSRYQPRVSFDARIDPDASATGDSFNHSVAHELRYDDGLGSPAPIISRTAGAGKRSRCIKKKVKVSNSEQWGQHFRSSCADEIIAAALSDGTNVKRDSKSPDPMRKQYRQRSTHSGIHTESLLPAPIHFDSRRDCADLLAQWTASHHDSQAVKGTENASAQVNSIEGMLDDAATEHDNVAQKQVCYLYLYVGMLHDSGTVSCDAIR